MAARKPTRARPTPSKKSVAKPAKRSKAAAKKSVAKKSAPKPVGAKKASAKKGAAKKSAAKPVGAKKAGAKKAGAKKSAANKAVAKPIVTKKTAIAKKSAAKPLVVKKAAASKSVAKPAVAKKAGKGARPTPARDALNALAQKKAISSTLSPVDAETVVDAYMRDVEHPFKAEMQAIRQIILGASPKISERIKWNAPSFYYKEDLGAFNPRATEFAHLILLFPDGAGMDGDTGLLEGNHKDRREAKFRSMNEVSAKKGALVDLVRRWVELRDA
ncbi:MAG TPA: DUF1801 domain-containing protein [Polyangiaceae bacterium]|nr:DUF1801 domain-containing protein [Polyangiaceae bacterium]